MPYRIRSDIRHCAFTGRIICLDLSASRYFLLEEEAAEAFAALAEGAANNEQINWLAKRNLVETGVPLTPPPPADHPAESLYDGPVAAPSPWLLLEAIISQSRARRRLSDQSLGALIVPTDLPSADFDRCQPVAAAFARSARYRDATDQCLVRALAMRTMLAHRGLGVDLVIGVTLPFAAHCWIQAGAVVLSDPLDRVRNFKPLLTAR